MNRQQVAIQVALGTSFLLALSLLLNKRKQQIVEIADKVSSTFEKPIDALKRKTRMDLYGISLKHLRNELNFEKTATIHELSKAIRERTLLSFGYRSYAQYLFSNPKTKHFVKPVADIYISYAWGSTWGEILDSLCDAYLKDGSKDDIFVWLDVFNLDQHEMKKQTQSTEEFSELAENLKKTLVEIGKAALLITPNIENPLVIERSWGIFQWHCIATLNIPCDFVYSDQLFLELIAKAPKKCNKDFFVQSFQKVNIRNSQNSAPQFQDNLHCYFKTIGYFKVRKQIIEKLRDLYVHIFHRGLHHFYLGGGSFVQERASLLNSIGCVYELVVSKTR